MLRKDRRRGLFGYSQIFSNAAKTQRASSNGLSMALTRAASGENEWASVMTTVRVHACLISARHETRSRRTMRRFICCVTDQSE